MQITQTNASPVAAEAIDAGGAGGFSESTSLTGVQVSAASSPSASAMSTLANAVRLARNTTAATALVGATASQTIQCTNGGSYTVTATYSNRTVATPGDHADLAFNNCVEDSATITGGLSVTVVSASSTLTVVDASASSFTIATATGSGERISGALRLTIDETRSTTSVIAVTGGTFSFDRLQGGTARASRTLTNYNYRLETTLATGTTAQTFSYTASGSFPRIGTVAFDAQTTQAIVTPGGALYPTSGAGKVTGANGSSVTVTVISTGLRLDIDDGVNKTTLTRTWAEINGEL